MPKTTALTVSLAVLALAAGLAGCGAKEAPKKAAAADARAVTVTQVEMRPLSGGIEASGVLSSREEAAVGSELTGYRIAKVYVEQGAHVRAGQPLVQLDDTLLRAQIAQQAAQTAQSEAEAKRAAGLDGQGVLSQEQIESRRYQAKAQAAALAELKTREQRMTVTAPVGGLVLERNVRPGDVASAGGTTPMFRIARDSLIELEAQVAENDIFRIRVGDAAQVILPNGKVIDGTVRLIDPIVDSQTKLGKVRIRLPVRDDLRPGGFGRAVFGGVSQPLLSVPERAVRYDANGASVVVVGADNRVHQVEVKTGRRGGGLVELLQGPPAGSRVLLGAASFALEGDLVEPRNEAASAPAAGARR